MMPLTVQELELLTLTAPFANENVARLLLERLRWPGGVACPHCRRRGAYALSPKAESRRPVREGVWKCKWCRRQFTVRVGTFFEDSRIPFSKWVMAVSILCASPPGITASQLERMLDLSYKSAWRMSERFRWAMSGGPLGKVLATAAEGGGARVGRSKARKRKRRPHAEKPAKTARLTLAPVKLEDALRALLCTPPRRRDGPQKKDQQLRELA